MNARSNIINAPECIWDAHAKLGEGPLWSIREQALYWVDILGHQLHRYSPREGRRTWQFDQEISSVAERAEADELVVTLRHGFAIFEPATGALTPLMHAENERPGNRFNDGKCDDLGHYWAGTMDFACIEPTGSLYRLSTSLQLDVVDEKYAVTNGPAWSIDGRTLYHNDSAKRRVYAFDFDMKSGRVSNKRLFLEFAPEDGAPDGMCTDAEGGLWIAHWGASKVTRHDDTGRVLQTITLPCSQITSCTFGGPELTTLYITSAANGLSEEQLAHEPHAGGLFAVELDIAGLPANPFRG